MKRQITLIHVGFAYFYRKYEQSTIMNKNFFLAVISLAIVFSGCKKDPFVTDDSGTYTDTRDQSLYPWVRIGEQIWMGNNMAYLPYANPSTVVSTTEARSYVFGYEGTSVTAAMATPNWDNYGALYNYAAALIACPDGWHLPTDAEWKTMEMYLGMSQADADKNGWRTGGSVELKLKATTAWGANSNTNSAKFNAIPSGLLDGNGFYQLMTSAVYWTATSFDATKAYDRYMSADTVGISRGAWPKSEAYSVRCIRD